MSRLLEVEGVARWRWLSVALVLFSAWSVAFGQERLSLAAAEQVEPPNDRIHDNEMRNIRVRTAVPSREETRERFGVNLYRRNIQPVWIEIENLRDEDAWFLPSGLDEAYFTPIETTYRLQGRIAILNPKVNIDVYDKTMSILRGR